MVKPKPAINKGKQSIPIKQKPGHTKKSLQDKKNHLENPAILLGLILIITFIAFIPSLSNQFINSWDDNLYVTDNPMIRHLNWESIKGFFTAPCNAGYIPLPLFSWALEYKLFHLNPFPYHLDNLLLHLLCTSLVFYLLILLRLPVLYAALGTLLFGIHPMHVESVAWVTERKDLLFAVFYVGSLITYIKYVISEKKKTQYFVWTLVLFVLSLLSKIQAVSLPFCLFMVDYWLDRKWQWKLLWEKIPFLVLSFCIGLIGYLILRNLAVIDTHDKYSFLERILFGLFALSSYIVKMIVPMSMSILYPYPMEPGQSIPLLYWLSPLFLVAIAVLVVFATRRNKVVLFGALFFFFNVVFVLQFVRAGSAYRSDRYSYISYIGPFFILAWAAWKLAARNKSGRRIVAGLALLTMVFFFSGTYARCKDWKDNLSIWNDVIEKFPERASLAYSNRGAAYGNLGEAEKGIADESNAIAIDPKFIHAYYNRGVIYMNTKQWDKAIDDFSKAIRLDPKLADAYFNRGISYGNLGQWDKAITEYTWLIENVPDYLNAYINRGAVYGKLGQWDKALAEYARMSERAPKNVAAWYNSGLAYANLGQTDKAIAAYSTAIGLDRNFIDAYINRSVTYGSLGQWDKVLSDCTAVIGLDPKNATAWYNRGLAYGNMGQWANAVADFSKAIEINPNYQKAYYNRDYANKQLQGGGEK